jgi:hypothetical protein
MATASEFPPGRQTKKKNLLQHGIRPDFARDHYRCVGSWRINSRLRCHQNGEY